MRPGGGGAECGDAGCVITIHLEPKARPCTRACWCCDPRRPPWHWRSRCCWSRPPPGRRAWCRSTCAPTNSCCCCRPSRRWRSACCRRSGVVGGDGGRGACRRCARTPRRCWTPPDLVLAGAYGAQTTLAVLEQRGCASSAWGWRRISPQSPPRRAVRRVRWACPRAARRCWPGCRRGWMRSARRPASERFSSRRAATSPARDAGRCGAACRRSRRCRRRRLARAGWLGDASA